MKRPIVNFYTTYGNEEYIVHSILPNMQIFQLKGPRDVRTWQETDQIFRSKVGFWGLVKLSLQIAYYKRWDFK